MRKIQQAALAAAAVGLMATASLAQAVPFSITSASFTPNGGYGQDRCEVCGATLDVRFANTGFTPQNFQLGAVGDSRTFAIGTVNFQEPDTHGGIRREETDNLGVKGFLGFTSPDGKSSLLKFSGSGQAYAGAIGDPDKDYILSWLPRQVHFGSKGLLEISFSELSFTGTGLQTLMATVTLLDSGSVPEPGTMALFGLALAGLGMVRRRKAD